MKTLKKGAMFGLDARISLAIFGALSVISGATIYSAIQEAKTTSTITELKELIKAFESYYLDTGSILPTYDSNTFLAKSALLVTNPVIPGWKGPYIQMKDHFGNNLRFKGNDYHIAYARENLSWSSPLSAYACNSSNPCFVWSRIYDHTSTYSESLKKALDLKIDKIATPLDGDFRWDANSITIKGISIQSPN